MPTYEYRCPQGHEFEHFYKKISDATPTYACPTCGQESERLISAGAGLVFKGSGFYITDYGKDGKKDQKAAPSTTKSESKGESSSSSGSGAGEGSGSKSSDSGSSSSTAPAPAAAPAASAPAPKPASGGGAS